MDIFKYIVLRKEIKLNEYRVPLIPIDCKKLIEKNIIVYVEKSENRCFTDIEYSKNGCILIDSYINLPEKNKLDKKEILIVGLKDLDSHRNIIYSFNHLYFSHTFKNQLNSLNILKRFKSNGGSIYDLEYFTNENNIRLFAFGYYAGIVGCYLGLLQYYYKKQASILSNIKPFDSFALLLSHIQVEKSYIYLQPTIAIIGNGRCAKGCMALLSTLQLPYTVFTKENIIDHTNLSSYNIILNCILITGYIKPFITMDTINKFKETDVIVDISCDYNNINNPLPIYSRASTFEEPIISINNRLDIISIDNLPSLLPRESSSAFSSKLIDVIILSKKSVWDKVRNTFLDKIKL